MFFEYLQTVRHCSKFFYELNQHFYEIILEFSFIYRWRIQGTDQLSNLTKVTEPVNMAEFELQSPRTGAKGSFSSGIGFLAVTTLSAKSPFLLFLETALWFIFGHHPRPNEERLSRTVYQVSWRLFTERDVCDLRAIKLSPPNFYLDGRSKETEMTEVIQDGILKRLS